MLAQFAAQRTDPSLESVVGLLEQDPPAWSGWRRISRGPEPAPIPPGRLAGYRARLQTAGIAHGLSHYGDGRGVPRLDAAGWPISGSGKSFVHAERAHPDATVIDGDLDAAVDALADKDVLLQRRIGDGLVAAAGPALSAAGAVVSVASAPRARATSAADRIAAARRRRQTHGCRCPRSPGGEDVP